MKNLYKKELNYYLNNPIGYIVIILFGVFANFLFVKDLFLMGSASMRSFFALLPWLLMVFVPALTMRMLSEEKKTNTLEVLLTLPISETQIILAKFLALITLVFLAFLLTVGLPVSLSFLTKMYLPEILIGYLGALLLAASFISLSLFFSDQTTNQVVAFLAAVITIFLLLVLATDFTASILPKTVQDFLSYFSPGYHLQNFIKGIVDLRSLFYFLSMTVLFLIMTIIDLEKRK
jgi:ABC-2 type transport system permease protein